MTARAETTGFRADPVRHSRCVRAFGYSEATVTLTRILTLSIATAALLITPTLQERADAQGRRGYRAAAVPRRGGVVVAAYYRPVFVSPFYDPFYDPWFPYRYGWYPPVAYGYPPYGYGGAYYAGGASLRVQVSPRETEVFINGYYAGPVDSFDGFFQRLHVEPGEHDVTLYLAGYRTVTQKVLLQPGGTFRIRHTMEPLGPGETTEPRPVAPAAPSRGPSTAAVPSSGSSTPASPGSYGSVAIRVQPADAEVFIDGEQWQGPGSDEALVIQVAPGPHRIEVRKDGYRSYSTQLDVRAGQTAPLNVSLSRP
jgi:hypothetical protein